MLLLRGAASQQLGEMARQLGARLHRHQAALAGALLAAVERGSVLVAQAGQQRASQLADLDATATTLCQIAASLSLPVNATSR
jgi:hypothetical protein